jgi:hypothetical protein
MEHGERENKAILQVVNSLLKPDIDAGILSVSALWDEELLGIKCGGQGYAKMCFYQQCLYRAKSTSEFIATWDLDEYFLFNTTKTNRKQHLPGFLRGIVHPECQDWSYITMESSFAGRRVSGNQHTGLAVFDYPWRQKTTNAVWQKSISRTKNVFLNSYHIPGSSLPQGKSNMTDAIGMHPNEGKCAFYVDEAIMVHVQGIQSGGVRDIGGEPTVENEMLQHLLGNDIYDNQ